LCRQIRRQRGGRKGARVRRGEGVCVARHRDRRTAETFGAPERTDRGVGRAHRSGLDRPLDDALSRARERRRRRRGVDAVMLEPLYTADEMRAAEQGHDVEAMMERAGRAVADAVLRRYPEARRIAAVCGKGANGGDGRIALRLLAEAGRETAEELDGDADVVLDALFGTGFRGEPRPEAAALIER